MNTEEKMSEEQTQQVKVRFGDLPFLLQQLIQVENEVKKAVSRKAKRFWLSKLRDAERKWKAWLKDKANAAKVVTLKGFMNQPPQTKILIDPEQALAVGVGPNP